MDEVSRTAAEAMLTTPARHPLSATVGEIRDFFRDDHVHAALIVSPAGYLEAVVERDDIAGCRAVDAAVAPLGRLAGRTVPDGASLADVHRAMIATGRRRIAVTSADGRLLGLLCLKASQTGFCSEQDVRARALDKATFTLLGDTNRRDGQLSGRTARRRVLRVTVPAEGKPGGGGTTARADLLAAEEPLGIRVDGAALTMTMRTPGDDIELAAGFLVSEAIVRSPGDIVEIKVCDGTSCGHSDHDGLGNIADVSLAPGVPIASAARRNFMTTSACGLCGKASIEDICVLPQAALSADETSFSPRVLACLPGRLSQAQRVFASTGGLHAAGLFTGAGELITIREDVGRHNAVDKLVGWAFLADRLPLAGCALLVSGRASFELVQKAVLAGVPLLAAISAPSSLAVDLAEEAGLTLVGFLRGSSMNVYTGAHRIMDGETD